MWSFPGGAWYCKSTDGIAGEALDIECTRNTREAAELAAAELSERYQGELDFEVLPRVAPVPQLVVSSVDSEDVPF